MKLFHISFDGDLEGEWKPQTPAGLEKEGKYAEEDTPRICVSPTIKQCFQAIYPNVFRYFENKDYPYMDIFVYQPQPLIKGIVYPKKLTKERWVFDAHVTDEHWITEPVKMKLIGKVRIFNTNKSSFVKSHPYNDPKEPICELFPKDIKISLLEGNIPTSQIK